MTHITGARRPISAADMREPGLGRPALIIRQVWGPLRRASRAGLGIAAALLVWWLGSRWLTTVRLPTPVQVWAAFHRNLFDIKALQYVSFGHGGLIQNIAYTASNVFVGVAVGTLIGLATGIAIGKIRVVRQLVEPPLLLLGTIPVVVLLPFLSLWFGASRIATSGLVIFYTAVTVTVGTQNATFNVAGHYEQYAVMLGASRLQLFREVIAPAVVPETLGSIRVALAFGWGFQAIAEVLGGQVGAGRLVRVFSQSSATAVMMAIVVSVGIVAVIADAIVAIVGRWVVRWQE